MTPQLYKAAPLVTVRQQIRQRELHVELRERLSASQNAAFEDVTATGWMNVFVAAGIYEAAAPLLHPCRAGQIRLVGRDIARAHLSGLYRCFVRAMTVPLLLEQTARLWGTYNRKGTLVAQKTNAAKCVELVLRSYPEYPLTLRHVLAGYILGSLELTGARDGCVVHDDTDSARWRYLVTWR